MQVLPAYESIKSFVARSISMSNAFQVRKSPASTTPPLIT